MIQTIETYKQINEGVTSPILYHLTQTDSLLTILNKNIFNLSLSLSTKKDTHLSRGYQYYMSCTTSKDVRQGYGGSLDSYNWARITLDADKLSNNYKFVPVDYWKGKTPGERWRDTTADEMEDRLLSRSATIPNFCDYITRVDIFGAFGLSPKINEIYRLCLERNIEFHVYATAVESTEGEMNPRTEQIPDRKRDTFISPTVIKKFCLLLTPVCVGNTRSFRDECLEKSRDYIKEHMSRFNKPGSIEEIFEAYMEEGAKELFTSSNIGDMEVLTAYKQALSSITSSNPIHMWVMNQVTADMKRYKNDADIRGYLLLKRNIYTFPYLNDVFFKTNIFINKLVDVYLGDKVNGELSKQIRQYFLSCGNTFIYELSHDLFKLDRDYIYDCLYTQNKRLLDRLTPQTGNEIDLSEMMSYIADKLYVAINKMNK